MIIFVENNFYMSYKFKFIDLFCGIGGFHIAMKALGGECVFASDIDDKCRINYELNYGIKPFGDITKINEKDIPQHDVLCAGFPCQSFSKAGNRLGFLDKTKGTLFFDVLRIMKECKPKYAILENVRNLLSHDNGNTWKIIHDSLIDIGYQVDDEPIIFSPHYIGIPQHRERVFILCTRNDLPKTDSSVLKNWKDKNVKCTIDSVLLDDDEISDISKYKISNNDIEILKIWNEFIQNIKCEKLPSFPIWSSYFIDEDNGVYPDWKRKFIDNNINLYKTNKVFIDKWLVNAKKYKSFDGAKAKLEWQGGQTKTPNIFNQLIQFRPSGVRVKRNDYFPALVAITQTSIIGSRLRYLTPRECARLQGFPDTYICTPNDRDAYRQFGNSVNVEVVKLIGEILFR